MEITGAILAEEDETHHLIAFTLLRSLRSSYAFAQRPDLDAILQETGAVRAYMNKACILSIKQNHNTCSQETRARTPYYISTASDPRLDMSDPRLDMSSHGQAPNELAMIV